MQIITAEKSLVHFKRLKISRALGINKSKPGSVKFLPFQFSVNIPVFSLLGDTIRSETHHNFCLQFDIIIIML